MGGYSCCLINEVGRKKRLLETFLFTRKPKGAEDEFFFSCVLFRSFHASISTITTLSLCCTRKNQIKYWYLVIWWNEPSSCWWVVEEAISLPKCSEGCGCFVFSHNSETINFPPHTPQPPSTHQPQATPLLPNLAPFLRPTRAARIVCPTKTISGRGNWGPMNIIENATQHWFDIFTKKD